MGVSDYLLNIIWACMFLEEQPGVPAHRKHTISRQPELHEDFKEWKKIKWSKKETY